MQQNLLISFNSMIQYMGHVRRKSQQTWFVLLTSKQTKVTGFNEIIKIFDKRKAASVPSKPQLSTTTQPSSTKPSSLAQGIDLNHLGTILYKAPIIISLGINSISFPLTKSSIYSPLKPKPARSARGYKNKASKPMYTSVPICLSGFLIIFMQQNVGNFFHWLGIIILLMAINKAANQYLYFVAMLLDVYLKTPSF